MGPSITVVITNYNHGQYLQRAVGSALNQVRRPNRVLVIDDGSTDNSSTILESLPNSVDVIRQSNIGIVRTRNKALSLVDTSHVIFLDADDYLHSWHLRWTELAWMLPHGKSLALVYTPARLLWCDGSRAYLRSRRWSRTALGQRNFITNTALMLLSAVRDVGGYSNEFDEIGHEDWDLMLKLAERGWTGRYLPLPLFTYCIRPEGRNAQSSRYQDVRVNRVIQEAHSWAQPGRVGSPQRHSPSGLIYKAAWRWDLHKWRQESVGGVSEGGDEDV